MRALASPPDFDRRLENVYFDVGGGMTNQGKSVAKLISTMLANMAVIGFGLAIYDNKHGALTAGIIAATLAMIITWRAER